MGRRLMDDGEIDRMKKRIHDLELEFQACGHLRPYMGNKVENQDEPVRWHPNPNSPPRSARASVRRPERPKEEPSTQLQRKRRTMITSKTMKQMLIDERRQMVKLETEYEAIREAALKVRKSMPFNE